MRITSETEVGEVIGETPRVGETGRWKNRLVLVNAGKIRHTK